MGDDIVIQFEFLRRSADSAAERLSLAAGDFFDLEFGELGQCDAPPKHLELALYINAVPGDLCWVKAVIHKNSTGESRTWEERYWGRDADCRMSIVTDVEADGTVDSETVVQVTDPKSGCVHVLRFGQSDETHRGGLRVHCVMWSDDEGEHSQTMLEKCPP